MNWTLIVLFISIPLFNCQTFPSSTKSVYSQLGLPPKLHRQIEEAKSKYAVKNYPPVDPELFAQLWQEIIRMSSLKELILEGKLQELLDPQSPGQTRLIFDGIENKLCVNHTLAFFQELTLPIREIVASNGTRPGLWAIQMIDSWGKIPDGLLSGHTSSYGDFEECLQVRRDVANEEDEGQSQGSSSFKGLYCLTYLLPNSEAEPTMRIMNSPIFRKLHEQLQLSGETRESVSPADFLGMLMDGGLGASLLMPKRGTCFPSSCTKDDVAILLLNTFAALNMTSLMATPIECYTDEKPDFDAATIAVICALGLILFLCIVGTLVDVLLYKNAKPGSALRGNGIKALVAFSLYTNTIKIMNTDSGKDSLGCLHGLRFWSMAWVVLGHTWMIMLFEQATWNTVDIVNLYKSNFSIMAILNAYPAVDTFFVMSGTLAAYNILRLLDKTRGRLNVPLIYIHRYLRLTPTYLILLGIMSTLMPYAGFGPNWYTLDNDSDQCRKYWWHNLLYITNLITLPEGDSGCYPEAWYLSNDMQFFLLSPIFLYPMWRWKRFGLGFLGLGHVASVIIPTVIKHVNELNPMGPITESGIFMDLYKKPWTRIGPYLVGMTLGYILNAESKSSKKSNRRGIPLWVMPGWIICTLTSMAVVFGTQRYMDPANQVETLTSFWSTIYGGFHRYVWGVCIAWIIYACVNGYGGWVNDFLSWKPFIPLGRLTFCVYMTSYHLQMIFHVTTLHPWHYSTYMGINIFFAHMVTSLLIGYVLTVTIESPFMQLEKLIFPQGKPRNQKKKHQPLDPLPVTVTVTASESANPDQSPHGMSIENEKET